jgi:hypothetical protein
VELDLDFLDNWCDIADLHEQHTGLKLALDIETVRELIARAERLQALEKYLDNE